MSFADWMRQHREDMGYSQGELAEATGIARTYIVRLEGGGTKLPGEKLRNQLHEVFETSDDDLVNEGVADWKVIRLADGSTTTRLEPRSLVAVTQIPLAQRHIRSAFAPPVAYDAADDRQAIAELVKHISDDEARKLRMVLEVFVDYGSE